MKIEININNYTITILEQGTIRFKSEVLDNGIEIMSCSFPDCAFKSDGTIRTIYLRGDCSSKDLFKIEFKNFSNLIKAYFSLKKFCELKQWCLESNCDFKRIKIS